METNSVGASEEAYSMLSFAETVYGSGRILRTASLVDLCSRVVEIGEIVRVRLSRAMPRLSLRMLRQRSGRSLLLRLVLSMQRQ
ncbi:hypothetical protein [Corynebacterium ulcerans]|uniref:Uncharacterized protein n=1 Tax=Corynebacterium ulcerans TaxID=65058 RepID=A0ABD7MVS8_CORUL|nr:hypothetical protein [Corynebacterium ulcerans]QQU26441.1 hypothetical protein I6I75_03780 [Corynebacterium ulcerans]SNV10626.1 Uncharacterised protein [Corynebacterium ulcerans]SQG52418.1 Uncharacterised protein [Corynebacterium ulcerans]SQH02920.1 Uncharacterised protein [Corynebacterium ulcerans]